NARHVESISCDHHIAEHLNLALAEPRDDLVSVAPTRAVRNHADRYAFGLEAFGQRVRMTDIDGKDDRVPITSQTKPVRYHVTHKRRARVQLARLRLIEVPGRRLDLRHVSHRAAVVPTWNEEAFLDQRGDGGDLEHVSEVVAEAMPAGPRRSRGQPDDLALRVVRQHPVHHLPRQRKVALVNQHELRFWKPRLRPRRPLYERRPAHDLYRLIPPAGRIAHQDSGLVAERSNRLDCLPQDFLARRHQRRAHPFGSRPINEACCDDRLTATSWRNDDRALAVHDRSPCTFARPFLIRTKRETHIASISSHSL